MTARPPLTLPARPDTTAARAPAGVRVQAPGRLHLGFFDPAATLGRRFGSLGLVVDGFEVDLRLSPAEADQLVDHDTDTAGGADDLARCTEWLARLRAASGCTRPLALTLARRLPPHAGFGSGTQLALALGRAFATLHGLAVDTPTLARWTGRGLRSGVGIAGFDRGGLLVDGGPSADGRPAPLLSRLELPADWRIVVLTDRAARGLSGAEERAALARLQPLPRSAAADLCHQVLMRILPGAADGDFALFAAGLNRLQQVLGEHFAAAQGGSAFTSAAVARLAGRLAAAGGAAIGQSSWGPTGFAVLPSAGQAEALLAEARADGLFDGAPGLQARVVAARAHGAVLS